MRGQVAALGRYALAAGAGAVGGALLVGRLTDVMPQMGQRMMSMMMQTMHAQMEAAGINPDEM